MKSILFATAALLAAAPALAQPAPPPGSPPPAGPAFAPPPPPPPPLAMPRPPGPPNGQRSAYIELNGPHGSSIKVRCAPEETTKACADVVGELLGRVSGMMAASRDGGGSYDREQGRTDQSDDYDRPRRRY